MKEQGACKHHLIVVNHTYSIDDQALFVLERVIDILIREGVPKNDFKGCQGV